MNLIGEVQGNYLTLQALLKKMPDEIPVSVGDMIDRGPRSLEVLEFFRHNGTALMGNHEHMMLDHLQQGGGYLPGLGYRTEGMQPSIPWVWTERVSGPDQSRNMSAA